MADNRMMSTFDREEADRLKMIRNMIEQKEDQILTRLEDLVEGELNGEAMAREAQISEVFMLVAEMRGLKHTYRDYGGVI
jgi:hypothetical protein